MIGFQHMPHSNQDTQMNIEFYHGTLKCWFSLETKGFRGCQIDWLVWRLTTTIAWHYMHTSEMKKRGFIKNKVVECIVKTSVNKATLIPFTQCNPTIFWKWWFLDYKQSKSCQCGILSEIHVYRWKHAKIYQKSSPPR